MRLLFVYYHKYEDIWRDGLYAAIEILRDDFEITKVNLFNQTLNADGYDFVLGWGAFGSPVDNAIKDLDVPKGLCIAGVTPEPLHSLSYDIVFYETDWFGYSLAHPNKRKAFGINTSIYKKLDLPKIYDYLSVGALAYWKRQIKLTEKDGLRLVIGEVQEDNLEESLDVANELLANGVGVLPMTSPDKLNVLYNQSLYVYIPAMLDGGGERAVLEARACGCNVIVENDNPKLKELLYGSIYSHIDYARELEKGLRPWL